jgi:hypothetical protein
MNCRANQTLEGKFRPSLSWGKVIQAPTLALALLSTPLAAGATEPPKPHTLTVFAAASLTESFNAIGTAFHKEHPEITIQFNFAASSTLVQQISSLSSKTVVTTSGSPSHTGQPVTFTATVTSKKGAIPDGELVTFRDGAKVLGSSALTGGSALFTTSGLSAKTHTIRATYDGDATFMPSTGKVIQVVEP